MTIEGAIEWTIKTAKHLIWHAREDIATETFNTTIDKARESIENKQNESNGKSRLRNILSIIGTITAIILLGLLNSTEVLRLIIEQFKGPIAAAAFAEQDEISKVYGLGILLFIFYLTIVYFLTQEFRGNKTGFPFFLIAYGFVAASVLTWAFIRILYNNWLEAESAIRGDWLIIMTIESSFIALIPGVELFEAILARENMSWLLAIFIFIIGLSLVILFGFDAYEHLERWDL